MSGVCVCRTKAGGAFDVLCIRLRRNRFGAARAGLNVGRLTLFKQMVVESGDFDDLFAVLARREHRAVLPKVQVQLLFGPCAILLTAKLTARHCRRTGAFAVAARSAHARLTRLTANLILCAATHPTHTAAV